MKTTRKITGVIMLLLCLQVELRAQENLENMIEKLMASNCTTQIINYNGPDKSLPTYTAKIAIYDKSLLDEFIAVFNKDKKAAHFSVSNPDGQDKATSAVYDEGGISHLYSYFIRDESNGLVVYSKYSKMNAAKNRVKNLSTDSLQYEMKILHDLQAGLNLLKSRPKMENDSLFMAIPYRIAIPGKSIITDGDRFVTSENLSFGSADKVPIKTNKKITIFIPQGDYMFINDRKYTAEEAREKGLNVVTF